MSSKKRWTLIPRKWFGNIAHAAKKRERERQVEINNIPAPPTSTVPHRFTTRNKTKVEPSSSVNDYNTSTTITQFQLPAFTGRRGKTSTVLPLSSTTLFNRPNALTPTSHVPSIRRNGQFHEPLSMYTTRINTQTVVPDATNILSLPSLSSPCRYYQRRSSMGKQSDASEQCIIAYPHTASNQFSKKSLSPTRTHSSSSSSSSSSSMENNESASSGIFSDERTNSNDRHRVPSKDTLSTLEILSTESLVDSRTSLDHCRPCTPIRRYRLSIPSFETADTKSTQLLNHSSSTRFHRVHSAEGILRDNQINRPIPTKTRQSSAAIVKKIEKRISTNRSPTTTTTAEKTNFVRVTNDTYRLMNTKENHLYRRQRPNSIIQHSLYDDSLPSANNEDCYAQLPRTSSTEQIETNLQNDLRAIVDGCLRPIVASINETTYSSAKTHQHSKQSHMENEHTQLIIEDITDKLLSSMDTSIYAQYQRCC